jgi:1A family penicillin-binding protein
MNHVKRSLSFFSQCPHLVITHLRRVRDGILSHPFKAFGIALGVAILGFLILFAVIDRRVATRLRGRAGDQPSLIYSDAVRLVAGTNISAKTVIPLLEQRRYFEVTDRPDGAGQYSRDGESVQIVTRPFRTAQGVDVPSVHARLDLARGSLLVIDNPTTRSLFLEPLPIAPYGGGPMEARTYRPLDEIPQVIVDAVLATEDQRFYYHFGIDPIGILRAIVVNLRAGKLVEGGSTLTQQLAKNILLSPQKTLSRKAQEAFAALSLELRLSKKEILERYLNEIYFAQSGSTAIHGVNEAAHVFFGKDLKDVDTAEAALLAGMIQAPSAYSPRRHVERATERRNAVLAKMLDEGKINQEEYQKAVDTPIKLAAKQERTRTAPFYVATLERHLETSFGFQPTPFSGVDVYTSIDLELQECAENAITTNTARLEKTYPSLAKNRDNKRRLEQALVAIEPYSGLVRAWVGGRDFSHNQFDHVSQAHRQIGSTIKPFLYLTALDGSLNDYKVATPVSILSDEPTRITLFNRTGWTPENYDRKYRGDVTLRYALEKSLNVPAVYVAQRVGIPALVRTAQLFNLAEEIPQVPALALGALDTTLLRLTAAYGALANGGVYVAPRLFRSVVDQAGSVLAEAVPTEKRVIGEGSAFVLSDMLRGVVERGTAQGIRRNGFTRPAAGKTGTSNENRDAWFVGFTPNLAVGVWTGFDDNSRTGLTGGQASVPAWSSFMKCAEPFIEDLAFIQPPSVSSVAVDTRCNGRATPDTPPQYRITELFVQGTEPQDLCEEAPKEEFHPPTRPLPVKNKREYEPEQEERGFWDRIFG